MFSLFQRSGVIYYFEQGKTIEIPSKLSKVAVISFKDLTFYKKDFPPISKRYLSRIIEEELEEYFPKEKYVYFWQILAEQGERREVGIWIYERDIEGQLKAFKCKYLIPEPLLYSSKEPTIYIIDRDEYFLLVHSQDKKILNYRTLTQLDSESLFLFLKGIKGLKPKTGIIIANREITLPELTREHEITWTWQKSSERLPFLDFLIRENLKRFQVRGNITPILEKIEPFLLLRGIIYVLVAISVSFYLSERAYEREIRLLKERMDEIRVNKKDMGNGDIKGEIEAIRERGNDPLFVLKRLSELLPQGSVIRRLYLSEDTLELSLTVGEPLVVFNNLSWERCFQEIKLGSPARNEMGLFNLDLKIATSKCRSPETK